MDTSDRSPGAEPSEGVITADGIPFFYRSIGSGPPLLILHGGPGLGHAYLRPAMDSLADGFRVIYWDQRGSGRTPVGDPRWMTLAGAVEDLGAIVDGLGLTRANLVGHSYGADLAALFAARYPERVGSMVVANPGPPFGREGIEALETEMRRRRTPDDRAALRATRESAAFQQREPRAVEEYIRNLYRPFFDQPTVAASLKLEFTAHGAATVVDAEEAFFEDLAYLAAAMDALERVTAPTLVVYAEREPIPESFARSLADRIPGGQFAYIKDANHFAYLETPKAFFGIVQPFLREHANAAQAP